MEGFCRACLIQSDTSELIQYTEKNRRLFVYCSGIQVKHNDALTFQLCKDCYYNMQLSCKFKKMCRKSDKKLSNYLALTSAGEDVDFTTFLKNSDDNIFRLPLSRNFPEIKKTKDDDNESTCTSIQNFISDLMESQEIPTEDSIIQEVIEEESDILDNTLDSHWLEDEDVVNTDFNHDVSFSAFSSPQYVKENHCYTPNKLEDELEIAKSLMVHNDNKPSLETCQQFVEQYFVPVKDPDQRCTIDRNLEKSLRNEDNESFYLDDLLVTPQLCSNMSGSLTPLITNVLFGDKLDTNADDISTQKEGHCIESFQPIQAYSENSEELFAEDPQEYELGVNTGDNTDSKDNIKNKDEGKFCVTNFYCKMCNKQFKNLTALKAHFTKLHKIKINYKGPRKRKIRICDYCGQSSYYLAQFIKHIKTHSEPPQQIVCKYCTLKFSSESKLRMHMTTHIFARAAKNLSCKENKKFVCTICGAYSSSLTNLNTHQKRHTKNYTVYCKECGRGFYRKSDLTTHSRRHTGEKPFPCQYCDRRFGRRDILNKHMKLHNDEKPFRCTYCNLRYLNIGDLRKHLTKGKLCLQMRNQLNTEDEPVKDTVSVKYAKVVGTNVLLDNL